MSKGLIDDIRLRYLLEKFLANECSYEEYGELLEMIKDNTGEAALHSILGVFWEEARWQKPSPAVDSVALYKAIILREGELSRRRRLKRRRTVRYRTVGIAAALAFVFAWCLVLVLRPSAPARVKPGPVVAGRFKNDVKPGGNKAVLVLANGQSIVLDSASLGTLAVQGGMRVVKAKNGQLVYQFSGAGSKDSLPVFNTISTPRGGQYQLVLQDGTRVWLNSESSLRFPTAFIGKERCVELSGEAYFEVAPHAVNPFKIYMLDQPSADGKNRKEIDVLGTSFNVMAYSEEKVVRTTLLEGAIRVGDENSKSVLKPGQQAVWTSDAAGGPGSAGEDAIKIVNDADVDAAVAWKNGFFSFDRSDIRTIMRQLSRWYDLKVIYNNGVGKEKMFWGGIQRDLPLSDVLRILEKSGVEFSIDGNNVIVNM